MHWGCGVYVMFFTVVGGVSRKVACWDVGDGGDALLCLAALRTFAQLRCTVTSCLEPSNSKLVLHTAAVGAGGAAAAGGFSGWSGSGTVGG